MQLDFNGYSVLRSFGRDSYVWSGIATSYNIVTPSSAKAYNFVFNVLGIYPSNGPWERYYGFPVRCLVYVVNLEPS